MSWASTLPAATTGAKPIKIKKSIDGNKIQRK